MLLKLSKAALKRQPTKHTWRRFFLKSLSGSSWRPWTKLEHLRDKISVWTPPTPLNPKKKYLAENKRNFTLSFVEKMRVFSLKLELLYILVGESSPAAQAPLIAFSKLLPAQFFTSNQEKKLMPAPEKGRLQQLLETGAKYRNLLRSVRGDQGRRAEMISVIWEREATADLLDFGRDLFFIYNIIKTTGTGNSRNRF